MPGLGACPLTTGGATRGHSTSHNRASAVAPFGGLHARSPCSFVVGSRAAVRCSRSRARVQPTYMRRESSARSSSAARWRRYSWTRSGSPPLARAGASKRPCSRARHRSTSESRFLCARARADMITVSNSSPFARCSVITCTRTDESEAASARRSSSAATNADQSGISPATSCSPSSEK